MVAGWLKMLVWLSILLCLLPWSNMCEESSDTGFTEDSLATDEDVPVAMETDALDGDTTEDVEEWNSEMEDGEAEVVEDATQIKDDAESDGNVKLQMSVARPDQAPPNSSLPLTLLNITDSSLLAANVANMTDKISGKKITCTARNLTENETAAVQIVNSTELLQILSTKNETQGLCSLVLFYAPWCVFCADTAPHYNALARAYPQVEVMAIDAIHFNNLNARFGTIAVPNILLFHNAKAVARFNNSVRTFETMVNFVTNITGLEANESVSVTEMDFEGPLPSVATEETDYLLWLAWAFVICFFTMMLYRSRTGQKIVQLIASFGQEHHHQHID